MKLIVPAKSNIQCQFTSIFCFLDHTSNNLVTKIIPLFLEICCFSAYLIPVGEVALLLKDSCMAPFILSMFKSCKEVQCECGVNILKMAVIGFDAWMQFHICLAGCTWPFFIFFAGVAALLNYLEILDR